MAYAEKEIKADNEIDIKMLVIKETIVKDTIVEHMVVKEICIGKIEALVCKDAKMEDEEEALAKNIKTNSVPSLFFRPPEEDEETS